MKAGKQFSDTLRRVRWPNDVRKKITKLIDLDVEHFYRMRRAYNHKSYSDSLVSGDWQRMVNAPNKYSPVADTIRAALSIRHVPDAPNPCKAMRRFERRQKERAGKLARFENPFEHPDLKRLAVLSARAGLVQSLPTADGENSLFLTEHGLETAKSMPSIADDATPQEVVTRLFSIASVPTRPPSPSPTLVDLVPIQPQISPEPSG